MLYAHCSPNCAGIELFGDATDFENLYEALHKIVGDEGEYPKRAGARLRILGICYDLRHAMMGDRDIEFVPNDMVQHGLKMQGVIVPDNNLYLKIEILWPEAMFAAWMLMDFKEQYAHVQKGIKGYRAVDDWRVRWDPVIANATMFQAAIAGCLRETLPETAADRVLKLLNPEYTSMYDYVTQYVDVLNVRFIQMDREKRLKNISIMAKRIVEQHTQEYQDLKVAVSEAADEFGCGLEDINIGVEYPDEYAW